MVTLYTVVFMAVKKLQFSDENCDVFPVSAQNNAYMWEFSFHLREVFQKCIECIEKL